MREAATAGEQDKFRCQPESVSESDAPGCLAPRQQDGWLESPLLGYVVGIPQVFVRRPEIEVCIVGGQRLDVQRSDVLQRLLVIAEVIMTGFDNAAKCFRPGVELPRRIGDDARVLAIWQWRRGWLQAEFFTDQRGQRCT